MNKKIWCDGSATIYGEKLGGSGIYVKNEDGSEEMYSLGWRNTKTGRAELHALLFSLSLLKNEDIRVEYYFDSEYVELGVRKRVWEWEKFGWINTGGKVKNKDLWEKIVKRIRELYRIEFIYYHVRGHQDNPDDEESWGNTIADYLADYRKQEKYYDDIQQ